MTNWADNLLQHEQTIRLSIFFSLLSLMLLWETLSPRRAWSVSRGQRWLINLSLVLLYTLLIRLLFPVVAVGMAVYASSQGWGLLNRVDLPLWLELIVGLLLLDMLIYWQHRLFHKIPLFWRLHRIHHTDIDYDVGTGIRFHPVEIILSLLIKLALVCLLGTAAITVLVFEIILSSGALFNHGNVRLPAHWDRVLRWFVVTPDMHRVHHSSIQQETDSNYGFAVPWWDYLFGSYCAQPRDGHDDMELGQAQYRDLKQLSVIKLLKLPFGK